MDSATLETPMAGNAGIDLPAYGDYQIEPGHIVAVSTGIAVAIPEGYFGLVCGRSGNAFKHFLFVCHNGVIDSNYRGEIKVLLENRNAGACQIKHGALIAQLVLIRTLPSELVEVGEFSAENMNTLRGTLGFGSSGTAVDNFNTQVADDGVAQWWLDEVKRRDQKAVEEYAESLKQDQQAYTGKTVRLETNDLRRISIENNGPSIAPSGQRYDPNRRR